MEYFSADGSLINHKSLFIENIEVDGNRATRIYLPQHVDLSFSWKTYETFAFQSSLEIYAGHVQSVSSRGVETLKNGPWKNGNHTSEVIDCPQVLRDSYLQLSKANRLPIKSTFISVFCIPSSHYFEYRWVLRETSPEELHRNICAGKCEKCGKEGLDYALTDDPLPTLREIYSVFGPKKIP